MAIKYILFDLDGTLLPMDQDKFLKAYLGSMARKLSPLGYNSEELIGAVWKGSERMVANDGSKLNEEVFWDAFVEICGERVRKDYSHFEDYYNNDFDKVKSSCGYNPDTPTVISYLKSKGYKLILATNPLFPSIATECRIRWAGVEKSDFELYTTYENSRYCKPNLDYYRDILSKFGIDPKECMMVGNDIDEDMIAAELGMSVYLVTDCLINRRNRDISIYPHGSLSAFLDHLAKIE